jgi:hypothetical protein
VRAALPSLLAVCAAACSGAAASPDAATPDAATPAPEPVSGCLAQATAVYDSTPVARRADGTVWVAKGRAAFVEILGPDGHLHATDLVAGGSTAYGTAVGCAVVTGGGVWCFSLDGRVGDPTNLGAGLGSGMTTASAVAVVTGPAETSPAPLAGVRQLGASMYGNGVAFCALTDAGGVWCWGSGLPVDVFGRGEGATSSYARPVLAGATTPLANVVEVRVGYDSACARKTDGSVWCWGDGKRGQRGVDPAAVPDAPYPTEVSLPAPARKLAASPGQTHCAILNDDRVACWGWNAWSQAGAPNTVDAAPPTIVLTSEGGPPLRGVTDLAPDRGMQAMCANTGRDGFVCWGHPFPLAGGADSESPYPTPIPTGAPVRVPLSAYGGIDGALVYVSPPGQLTLGAGALPFSVQPPCE